MAEFEEKLNTLLGDPEAMGQILSIARALTGGGEPGAAAQETPPAPAEESGVPSAPTPAGEPPDWSSLLGLLGGLSGGGDGNPLSALGNLDPRLIQTALTLFSEYSAGDDRKIALLNALKPFLKEERYAKVDKAIQIAKLSRVIRVAFQLFKERGREMYNRYIPSGTSYARVLEEDGPPPLTPEEPSPAQAASAPDSEPPADELPKEAAKKPGLAGLLKGLKLDSLDTGDILLLLILLFLFLEGDDMELIITLGLLLLLGLD